MQLFSIGALILIFFGLRPFVFNYLELSSISANCVQLSWLFSHFVQFCPLVSSCLQLAQLSSIVSNFFNCLELSWIRFNFPKLPTIVRNCLQLSAISSLFCNYLQLSQIVFNYLHFLTWIQVRYSIANWFQIRCFPIVPYCVELSSIVFVVFNCRRSSLIVLNFLKADSIVFNLALVGFDCLKSSIIVFNCVQLTSTAFAFSSFLQLPPIVCNCRELSPNSRNLLFVFNCCLLSSIVFNCRQLSSIVFNWLQLAPSGFNCL